MKIGICTQWISMNLQCKRLALLQRGKLDRVSRYDIDTLHYLQPGLYVCMAAASKCVLGIEGIILWGGGRLGWRALQIGTCGMLGISGIWDGIMRERTEWLLAVSLMSQSHAAGRMNWTPVGMTCVYLPQSVSCFL